MVDVFTRTPTPFPVDSRQHATFERYRANGWQQHVVNVVRVVGEKTLDTLPEACYSA
jgi:hypothetical protein